MFTLSTSQTFHILGAINLTEKSHNVRTFTDLIALNFWFFCLISLFVFFKTQKYDCPVKDIAECNPIAFHFGMLNSITITTTISTWLH